MLIFLSLCTKIFVLVFRGKIAGLVKWYNDGFPNRGREFDSPIPHKNSRICYNGFMKNILQFIITEEDGVYTASATNAGIVTDGKNFEELKKNILEAVELYFEGEDPVSLGFSATPSILTNYELSLNLDGATA